MNHISIKLKRNFKTELEKKEEADCEKTYTLKCLMYNFAFFLKIICNVKHLKIEILYIEYLRG